MYSIQCTHFKSLGLLWLGVYVVFSLEIKADAHVRGYVGENIKLRCTFKSSSSVTDKLTIDWTYRPPSSSRTESVSVYFNFYNIYLFGCVDSHGLFSCGTWLSCPTACGVLVSQPGIEPTSPALQGGFLTTGPPQKSHPWKSWQMVDKCMKRIRWGLQCS